MATERTAAGLTAGMRELAEVALRSADELEAAIAEAAALVRDTLADGGTIFFCGNGGSAADAQHMATEYVIRYMKNRRALAAVALTTDTSLITACGNDFSFDQIFERQVEALCRPGDLLIIHSTSGNSPNVLLAAKAARAKNVRVLALGARGGGQLRALADLAIVVPTDRTDRAQELHLCIEHAICDFVERELT